MIHALLRRRMIESRSQPGQAFIAHQHEKVLLVEVGSVSGSKTDGPFLMA